MAARPPRGGASAAPGACPALLATSFGNATSRARLGLFSIILKPYPKKAVQRLLNALKIFGMGYSWGGFESLIVPFDCTAARTATVWKPQGPTLRLHIGLEDVEDLKRDLERGFAALAEAIVTQPKQIISTRRHPADARPPKAPKMRSARVRAVGAKPTDPNAEISFRHLLLPCYNFSSDA